MRDHAKRCAALAEKALEVAEQAILMSKWPLSEKVVAGATGQFAGQEDDDEGEFEFSDEEIKKYIRLSSMLRQKRPTDRQPRIRAPEGAP